MKKKNAFVLAESVVTAVFVLSFFTFIIVNMLPLIGEYESSLNYDDVQSKYDTHLIRKMLLRDDDCRSFNLINLSMSNAYYEFNSDELCLYLKNQNYCKVLLSPQYLDVKKVIITNYTGESLKRIGTSQDSPFDRVLTDYLRYMPVYQSLPLGSDVMQRRIVVEFNDGRVTNTTIFVRYNSSCLGGYQCEN